MQEKDKIQELIETQQKIIGQFENLKLQQGIFESRFKSELGKGGTLERVTDGYDKQLKEIHELIYNPDNGYAFEIDRLKQKVKKQEERRKEMWALWIAVIVMFIKVIFDEVTKK